MAILVASAALFGLMGFLAKLASARIGGAQIATVRFAVCLLPLIGSRSFRRAAFTFQRIDLLIYRGIFGGIAVLLYFLAIEHIPLGTATLLNHTSPIFAGIFAARFVGERMSARVVLPLMLTMAGLYLVVGANVTRDEVLGFGLWELAGLVSALASGAALTAIRLARRTEGSWAIFASLSLFGLLATAPFAVHGWIVPDAREWLLMIGVGAVSIAAQLMMTHAYRWIETMTAGIVSQFGVLVAMALGALFLAERITPAAAVGTALALGGVTAVIVGTTPKRIRPMPAPLPPLE